MKKTLSLLISALILLGLIGCDVTTQAPASSAITDGETSPLTTEKSEPTGTEKPEPTGEEARLLVEAAAEKGTLNIGGWVTPSRNLLDDDYDTYVKALEKCVDAGINYVYTLDEGWSTNWLSKYFTAANKAKLRTSLFLGYHGNVDDGQIEAGSRIFDWYFSAPGVFSVNIYDEPSNDVGTLEKLGEYAAEIRGYSTELPVGANLFPTYAYSNLKTYNKYLSDYSTLVKPDYMSFDYYPYTGGKVEASTLAGYIQNFAMVKIYADKLGVPVHTFIQSSNRTTVSREALSLLVNVSVASGANDIIYYTLFPYSDGKGVLNADGSTGKLYDSVKAVNTAVNAMQGVYLSFKCDGIMTVGQNLINKEIQKGEAACGGKFLLSSHGSVSTIEATQALVGCYTKGTQTGYYIVNTNLDEMSKITLKLNGEHTYQTWGEGLEVYGTSSSVEVEIPASGAKFIIIDADNSTNREEYKLPETFIAPVEVKSGMLADIKIEDGKIVNKASNGVKLVASTGEATADGGVRNYRIRTETLQNAADGVINVECDIMITGDGNVDIFRDIYDNFNLLRYDDFWFGVYGGEDYNNGNTGLTIDTALPKNQKLHIEIEERNGMQKLTVNGKVLVSGSINYTATDITSFLFDGTGGNVVLYSAKISVGE